MAFLDSAPRDLAYEDAAARGEDALPEMRPDGRSFTIWDTIRNTIEHPDLTLYLVLDEAHRGMNARDDSYLHSHF